MSAEPEEPRMVEASTRERYCTLRATHPSKRIMTSDDLGHVVKAHCQSPTCSWCVRCYTARTGRRPA